MRYLLSLIALLMFVPSLHAQVGPLPCGANSSLSTWRQDFGYSIGQVVLLNGVTYQSLVNNNINQNPCTYQGSMWSNVVGSGGGGGGGSVATYTTPGLAPQGIAYVYASQVTGSVTVDQLINAAGASLPAAGGIIDARGLGSNTYHITGQITALNNAVQAVTLILNPQTYFIIDTQFNTLTNDPSSCAIQVGPGGAGQGQFNGASSIIVPGANRLGNQEFFLGPNARVWDVICNGSFQGNQESMMLDGVSVRGNPTAQMGGALIHIQGVFGPTLVANSNTEECFGQCLEVDSANGVAGTGGGSIMFLNDVWSDYFTGSQVYPGSVVKIDALTNQGGIGEIAFVGGIIQGNGPHNPLIVMNGRGSAQLGGISFVNNYLEIQPAATSIYNSNVDPIQLTDANQISWDQLRLGGNKSSSQTHIIDIGSTANGNTYDIRIGSFVTGAGWSSIIHNTVDGTDETGYPSGRGAIVVPAYSFGGVIPTVRLSNVVPPSSACTTQTLGTLWSDSASQTGALYVCETIGAAPTWFNVSPASPTTIAGMAPDELNGLGLFATGASDFPTGFGATGCVSGNTCTFTRSTSTVPSSNYTYSVQVNITANPLGNMNGLESSATVAYVAGQTYVYSFWAKSDGSLVANPTAILGNPTVPGSICFNEGPTPLTSTWTLYTFQCTPTTSGSTNLQLGTETQGNATGSFYLAGFQFTQITPLPPSGLISSVAPYGIGPASTAQQTITINSTTCVLGSSCSVSSGGPGFTLTTTGTSGAATLIGTVLNIPTPSAGTFTSLTTTGTSGAATLISGVLNIPTPPTTAVNATSLAGGAVGSAPYQSAANTTAFLASPTTTSHTFFYGWQPSGSALAPQVFDLSSLSSTTAASTSAIQLTGSLFTGGTGTTTFPMLFLNNSGATAGSSYSTAGTEIGVNAATGFSGNFFGFYLNGVAAATLNSVGGLTLSNSVTAAGASRFSTATAGTTPMVINNSATTPTADIQDWQANSITVATIGPAGQHTIAAAGALSLPAFSMTGAPIASGGTATTTFPLAYINNGATAPTTWSTAGTELGFNAPSAFAGNVIDVHINGGTSIFRVTNAGAAASVFNVTGLTVAGIVTNSAAGLLGTAATVPIANGGTGAATAGAGTYFGNAGTSTAAPSFVSNSYDNLVAGAGAVPTTTGSSCGTLGTPVGGTYAGTVTSTGATTCTLKLTFPVAAAHGYICIFYDITTSGDYYGFGSVPTVTTTSCQNTSSAITSGDTMQYIARPY